MIPKEGFVVPSHYTAFSIIVLVYIVVLGIQTLYDKAFGMADLTFSFEMP